MAYLGAVSGSGGYPSLAHQQHAQADRLKASINAGATAANIRADMLAKESLISSAAWYAELKALVKLADDVGSTEPYKAKTIAVLNGWKGV